MWFYKFITQIFHYLAPLVLKYRLSKGKEDKERYCEKLGLYHHSIQRPKGFLVRIHGASVGETLSSLTIIYNLLQDYTDISIMVTSNTVTSASLMQKKLPSRCFHVYAPLDTPQAIEKFYQYYAPNLEIILDSEIWPNSLIAAYHHSIPVFGVNTRLSDKSMRYWATNSKFFKKILQAYHCFSVQNEKIATFLAKYFKGKILICNNLKWSIYPEVFEKSVLTQLQKQTKGRFIVCLLSTHEAEEKDITLALVHYNFFNDIQNLLIIVPRHPHRKQKILDDLQSFTDIKIECRSDNPNLHDKTQIYIADTLGEIMLWSQLATLVFMGNSLNSQGGGHNPIEPASVARPILTGQKIANFTEIYAILKQHDACVFVDNATDLAHKLMLLRHNPVLYQRLAYNSYKVYQQYRQESLVFLHDIYATINKIKHHANT